MADQTNAELFLGVDGGQSHTEALIANRRGDIVGRGLGGSSSPGLDRLRRAVTDAVEGAVGSDRFPRFVSARFGMTGDRYGKEETIGQLIDAEHLVVGHDAPTALMGAMPCRPGVIVIAGTGSVVHGLNGRGETAVAGGLGYMFSDEGSGLWVATQIIRIAVKEADGIVPERGLRRLVTDFFGVESVAELAVDFYQEKVTRERIASLSRRAQELADAGDATITEIISSGAHALAEGVCAVASRLGFSEAFEVSGVGGMFRGTPFRSAFLDSLGRLAPAAEFTNPRFGPACGALLKAYEQAGLEISPELLDNLQDSLKQWK